MRTKMIQLLCCFLLVSVVGTAQGKKTETFKVFGNCEMCKANIEGALKKKDGILSKKWDPKTQMLTVKYNSSEITLAGIGKIVANAGYDNEFAMAPDAKYNALHACCKYERPKRQ
jgi:mercuric ion binding protein